ncbi:DUF3732 domain-containing protein [Hymenobacter sp. BT683]|uniref:DUF3732 domain-containing protein n=1 Tax=Hymenobacter jeongseonensis TaxID=2791027 RepID=A0ABS0IE28_9BACT|nr:DUF3732 domain-containing protein [Hymenobacter jeongseonensis]MBF9236609.1 DUF3732 domain-containing protein [Hymenobacter jeongseonensis]
MKFVINKIILWLANGQRRDLDFLPNKVNLVTGDSSTGKSTILRIVDYCLCKSSTPSKIAEEVINENTDWYGINLSINGKAYTIARSKIKEGVLSSEYYFSSTGEIPVKPETNISEPELKKILEGEFSIDSSLVIPYGGKTLKAGAKISFRYFLLFNTQSDNVIINEEQFFDKVNNPRYKEALDRIFGLALESTSPEGVLIAERLSKLTKDQIAVERKEDMFSKQRGVFQGNIIELISKAQDSGLIESGLPTINEGVNVLNNIVQNYMSSYRKENIIEIENLQRQKRDINRRLKNIEFFENSYNEYLETVKVNVDSLAPVSILKANLSDLVFAPSVVRIFESLEGRLSKLKADLIQKKPFAANLSDEKATLNKSLSELEEKISLYPTKSPDFVDEAQRLMLIGEIKAKLELYTQVVDEIDFSAQIEDIQSEISELQGKQRNLTDNAGLIIDLLQEQIQKYVSNSISLGVYQTYKAFFNEKDKILQLRKPGAITISDVGSSSNHLFLHLCLFLGLHDFFLQRKSKYIPQFLILDQLSRPYYEEAIRKSTATGNTADIKLEDAIIESDDQIKLREAFRMLDNFIEYAVKEKESSFQFIVLEHVSPAFINEMGLQHFHIVDNFRNGNALIPLA